MKLKSLETAKSLQEDMSRGIKDELEDFEEGSWRDQAVKHDDERVRHLMLTLSQTVDISVRHLENVEEELISIDKEIYRDIQKESNEKEKSSREEAVRSKNLCLALEKTINCLEETEETGALPFNPEVNPETDRLGREELTSKLLYNAKIMENAKHCLNRDMGYYKEDHRRRTTDLMGEIEEERQKIIEKALELENTLRAAESSLNKIYGKE